MPGQLVDVGGHRLHLHCTGSGSPTVVLEPGRRRVLRLLVGSRPSWPATAQLRLRPRRPRRGATQRTARRTGPTLPRTCTRCSSALRFPGRTCWPVTPPAACTSKASPPTTPTRSPAWCCWTPPPPNRPRPPTTPESYEVLGRVVRRVLRGGSPGCRTADRPGLVRHSPAARPSEARANASTARLLR